MKALAACLALTLPMSWVCRPASAQAQEPGDLRVDHCPARDESTGELSSDELEERRLKEAGDLYDRGLVLYEEGDYTAAVDAFVDSYCTKPHPSAYYNIAQSYERLLNFERSILYFERYVAEADPTAPNTKKAALRADVLRKLPAQLNVATVPEGAAITIRNQSGISARGRANAEQPIEITQGRYLMHIEMPGYESVDRELVVKPGRPYSDYVRLQARKAELQVTASPSSGRIFIDNRLVGVGKYSEALPVGTYEITVEAPGRVQASQSVQLNADERVSRSIVLDRRKSAGRWPLMVGATLGLGVGGAVAISRVFDQSDAITAVGSLAMSGFGLGSAYFGIPEDITLGDASYILGSSVVGLFEGSIVGSFFACDREEVRGVQTESCNKSAITGAALSGGIAGVISAALTYQKFELTTGDAAVLGSGAFWGIGGAAVLFAVFDSDVRIRDPMLFAGLNLGLVSAAGLVANTEVSLRRIAVIDLGGAGGALAGVSLAKAFDTGDGLLRHLALLGGVSGLIAGTFLTRDMDEDTGSHKDRLLPTLNTARDVRGQSVLSFGMASRF